MVYWNLYPNFVVANITTKFKYKKVSLPGLINRDLPAQLYHTCRTQLCI